MAYKFILVVAVVALSVDLVLGENCGPKPLEDMDELISNISPFSNTNHKAPTKIEDLPAFCSYYKNALTQVDENNKNCIKTGHRTMINVALLNIKKRSKDICSTSKSAESQAKRKSFVQLGKCIHSGGDKLRQCMTSSKDKIVTIENAPAAKRLGLLCCELKALKGCLFTTLTAQSGCDTESAAEKMRNYVATFGGGHLSTACAEHVSGNKCDGLAYPRKKKSQHAYKSFMLPVINVLNSL